MRLRERIARRLDPKVYENRDGWYRRYKELWEEHSRGCECHDSWDQCPCVEEGHQAYQVTWRGNRCECCRWCSKPSGQPSPFAVRAFDKETK